MTTIQLIVISTSAVLLLGIAAISVLVGGRLSRPKDWKKQVEKEALKVDKSKIDEGFVSEDPSITSVKDDSTGEIEKDTEGSEIVFEEKIVYEEISEEEEPNTKMLYTETLTNPTLKVCDLPAMAAIAKRHGLVAVDRKSVV